MTGLKKLAGKIKKEEKLASRTYEDLFIATVDDYMIKDRQLNERRRKKTFNPSSYFKCKRLQWYSFKSIDAGVEVSSSRSARLNRIFEVGSRLHEWFQDAIIMDMSDKGYPVKVLTINDLPVKDKAGLQFMGVHSSSPMEIKFRDSSYSNIPISAMIDGFINFMDMDVLFEFKTINADDFTLLLEPLIDHVKQGAMYSLCLGIDRVLFLYLCKNTQNLKAYVYEYNNSHRDWVIDRISEIEDLYKKNILPEKEVGTDCRYCAFKKLCGVDATEVR